MKTKAIQVQEGLIGAPQSPDAGHKSLFFNSGGQLCSIDNTGTVIVVGAVDRIFAYANSSYTLPLVGPNYQELTMGLTQEGTAQGFAYDPVSGHIKSSELVAKEVMIRLNVHMHVTAGSFQADIAILHYPLAGPPNELITMPITIPSSGEDTSLHYVTRIPAGEGVGGAIKARAGLTPRDVLANHCSFEIKQW